MANAATVLLLAGCASMAPSYEPPALPVAASYPHEAPANADGVHPANVDWQDYFPTHRFGD